MTGHPFQIIFNGLSIASLFLTAVITIIYILNHQNDLLIFMGIVIFLIQGILLTSSIFYSKNFSEYEYYSGSYLCTIQAMLLNYAIISLHALVACMMYDTWQQVISWKALPSMPYRNKSMPTESYLEGSQIENTSFPRPMKNPINAAKDKTMDNGLESSKQIEMDPGPQTAITTIQMETTAMTIKSSGGRRIDSSSPADRSNYPPEREGIFRQHRLGTLTDYLLISFVVPIFPTLILFFFVLGWGGHMKTVAQPFSCFCYITGTFGIKFVTFVGWCLGFSIPGLAFSFHLLYKMLFLREQSIQRGRITYLTKTSVSRIAFSTFIYFACVLFNLVPHIFFFPNDPDFPLNTAILPQLPFENINPYTNKYLCWWITPSLWNLHNPTQVRHVFTNNEVPLFEDPRLAYYAYMRCPTIVSLLPSLVGVVFFLMFGFGHHAQQFYGQVISNICAIFRHLRTFLHERLFRLFQGTTPKKELCVPTRFVTLQS